jgi:hypothetical protein
MLTSAIVGLALSLAGQSFDVSYDKFEDLILIRAGLGAAQVDGLPGQHKFGLIHTQKGQNYSPAKESDRITVAIAYDGPRWVYLQNQRIIVMEGLNRFTLTNTKYKGDIDDEKGGVRERIWFEMTIGEAKAHLASGRPWEIKIGNNEPLVIGPQALGRVRRFIRIVQAEPPDEPGKPSKSKRPKR